MKAQDTDELRAFEMFIKEAGLSVIPSTIEKRPPPEPDVLCRLETGRTLAFELVQICHPENAAFFGRCKPIRKAIEQAYGRLQPSIRDRMNVRFAGQPLSFDFQPTATVRRVCNLLPKIFEELASSSWEGHTLSNFSSAVQSVLSSVRRVGRSEYPDRPSFNIARSFNPEQIVLDAICPKLEKTYKTDHKLDLLAYFGQFAWPKPPDWKHSLRHALEMRGCGPFECVWVLGWDGVEFQYPS